MGLWPKISRKADGLYFVGSINPNGRIQMDKSNVDGDRMDVAGGDLGAPVASNSSRSNHIVTHNPRVGEEVLR